MREDILFDCLVLHTLVIVDLNAMDRVDRLHLAGLSLFPNVARPAQEASLRGDDAAF